jgi:hypothetical protein
LFSLNAEANSVLAISKPRPALSTGKKKLSFRWPGTLLVRRTDYEHWASGSVALASTVLEKSDRLRYSAIKITTSLRINLRSAGPHAKRQPVGDRVF